MTNEGGSAGLVDVRALLLRTDWNAVEHCCPDVAPMTPVILRHLLDDDPRVQGTAVRDLYGAVTHQGTFYSATAPAALFVAAILGDPRTLAMVTSQRPWEIDQHGEQLSPLRVRLLGWLGDTAQDTDYPPEWPPGRQKDIDAFLATRPALYDAVHPFLGDSEHEVRDAALFAILPLLADPALAHHIPALTDAVHELAARDTPYRWYAINRLAAWGQDTSRYPEPPQPAPTILAGVVAQDVSNGDHDPWAGFLEPWPDSVYDSLDVRAVQPEHVAPTLSTERQASRRNSGRTG